MIAERAGLSAPATATDSQYIATDLNSAELIKVTANAFLALKISFANSIAKLADHAEADINDVLAAVGADRRIGKAFLKAGRGYGGGCFPKDVSGLISSANEFGVDLQIMTAASDLNESMSGYIVNKTEKIIGRLQAKKVAVLGLAFKAGTSDASKSPGVKIANLLAQEGAKVKVYDPKANDESRNQLSRDIDIAASTETAIKDVDVVFVTTDWPEFVNYDLKSLAANMSGDVLVDCMNVYNIYAVETSGLSYIGVGRNGKGINEQQ
jgi:UDPglucose 6-dehydrogenase